MIVRISWPICPPAKKKPKQAKAMYSKRLSAEYFIIRNITLVKATSKWASTSTGSEYSNSLQFFVMALKVPLTTLVAFVINVHHN